MVLLQSLTVPERWVCATLACSCFVMYVLPGVHKHYALYLIFLTHVSAGLMPFMCGTADNRFAIMQWLYFVYFLGSVLGRAAVSLRPFHRIGSLTACSAVAWLVLLSRVFLWHVTSTSAAAAAVMLCVIACSVTNGVVSTMAFCMVSSDSATKILGLFNQAGALCGAMFAIVTVRTLLV